MEKYFKLTNLYNDLDTKKAINDLSYFIKCKTVSNQDQSKMDFLEFNKIHEYIINNYPYINKYGKYKVINKGSIYYYIEGKNKDLEALLLMGHIDVVPPIKQEEWVFDPFSGNVDDNYIYGRGALDMKNIDCAEINAIEYSLKTFGVPNRSIYLCFGHDEETLGMKGQWEIKNDLKNNKAKIGVVLDEGGYLSNGNDYKANGKIMEIQVMEKGYLDLEIISTSKGGHSSNPGNHTALGNVCHAIARIEDNQFEANLDKAMINFFKNIKDYITDDKMKELLNNIDNDPKSLANYLSDDKNMAPYTKTTIAATMIESDSKGANVLPQYVKALINLRLSYFDTVESAYNRIKDLCKDLDVEVVVKNGINASLISDINSKEYELLTSTIKEFFDVDAIVPTITVGGTDCCFYNELTPYCYRFAPIFNLPELESGVHGVNEKCSINSYIYGVKFYINFINKYCY